MKTSKYFPGLILPAGLCLISSCSGGSKTRVSVSLSHKFPEITVSGPGGKIVSLVPADKQTGTGSHYTTVDVPLSKIPVFIRKGSGIDPGNLNELYASSLKAASDKPDLSVQEKEEGWK